MFFITRLICLHRYFKASYFYLFIGFKEELKGQHFSFGVKVEVAL